MGRRELAIAIGFLVAGLLAYQVTAPPPKAGERSFSIARMWEGLKREVQADSASGSFRHAGTIAGAGDIRELRLSDYPRGTRLEGGAGPDITYELTVESTGPDAAAATAYAERTVLRHETLGGTLSIGVQYPVEARQTAALVLRVPRRIAARVLGGSGVTASGLRSVHLEGVGGAVTIAEAPEGVGGSFQGGELTLTRVGRVSLSVLQGGRTRLTDVAGGITLDVRNAECRLERTEGRLEVQGRGMELTVDGHRGPVRVGGTGGRVALDRVDGDVHVDMRRTEVELTIRQAVPLVALTTEEDLRVTIGSDDAGRPPAVTIDAVAVEGRIDAADLGQSPEQAGRDARLTYAVAPGSRAAVSLRNQRGDIVIRKLK